MILSISPSGYASSSIVTRSEKSVVYFDLEVGDNSGSSTKSRGGLSGKGESGETEGEDGSWNDESDGPGASDCNISTSEAAGGEKSRSTEDLEPDIAVNAFE